MWVPEKTPFSWVGQFLSPPDWLFLLLPKLHSSPSPLSHAASYMAATNSQGAQNTKVYFFTMILVSFMLEMALILISFTQVLGLALPGFMRKRAIKPHTMTWPFRFPWKLHVSQCTFWNTSHGQLGAWKTKLPTGRNIKELRTKVPSTTLPPLGTF